MNEYYIYEWIRLDTNEPFYVGKGKGKRWKTLKRENSRFNHIVNKHPVAVNILHDNLSENVANDLEVWYIREYRDVIGYDLCNIADGGEGVALFGEQNGFYNKNHSKETRNKMSKNHADVKREKHPQARKVICLNTGEIFNCINDAGEYYRCQHVDISRCCKGKRNTCGQLEDGTKLKWMYLEDYNNLNEREKKEKLNEDRKTKKVICITTNEIFKSIADASKFYDIQSSGISRCCKGESRFCGKLIDGTKLTWMFLSDYDRDGKE